MQDCRDRGNKLSRAQYRAVGCVMLMLDHHTQVHRMVPTRSKLSTARLSVNTSLFQDSADNWEAVCVFYICVSMCVHACVWVYMCEFTISDCVCMCVHIMCMSVSMCLLCMFVCTGVYVPICYLCICVHKCICKSVCIINGEGRSHLHFLSSLEIWR